MSIVTRFAPSPTGFLHIGGARTALFNWLFARRYGGRFLLRIEDTDRERSTQAAVDAILAGLDWLGLDSDAPPLFQSTRAERHREIALALVARKAAYRCYVPAAELEARRQRGRELLEAARAADLAGDAAQAEASRAEAAPLLAAFRSPWRDGGAPPSADAPFVIRLRAPATGETRIADVVQGEVIFDHAELDDMILLRSDGAPTYMLAVVVDDHDMGVTHVIRGVDHLTNAGRQAQIIAGMGWDRPVYAHVPLIHGADGAKLSKRHGALGVEAWRDMGYLPEALGNYLLRLGWAAGDHEILAREEAVKLFSLEGIGRSPARLDPEKIGAVNAHYLKAADDARLADLTLGFMGDVAPATFPRLRQGLERAMRALKLRAKTLRELAGQAAFLARERPLPLTEKAQQILADPETRNRLARYAAILGRAEQGPDSWRMDKIDHAIREFVGSEGIGLGKFGPALRAALTGDVVAPELAAIVYALGPDESCARILDHVCVPPACPG